MPKDGWIRIFVDLNTSGAASDILLIRVDNKDALYFYKGGGQYQDLILPFKSGTVIKAYSPNLTGARVRIYTYFN